MLSIVLLLALLLLQLLALATLILWLRAYLRDRFGHFVERLDGMQRLLDEQTLDCQTSITKMQAQTIAEIAKLRVEIEAQAHRVLHHLAWEEVERYIADETTPEAEKDFFRRLVSRRSGDGGQTE